MISTWQPPSNATVDAFIRLVESEQPHYKDNPFRPNLSRLDRLAQRWLRENSDTFQTIDCLKNLGDALILKSEVDLMIASSLREGFIIVHPAVHNERHISAQMYMEHLVTHAEQCKLVDKRTAVFLKSRRGTDKVGAFRV